MNDAELTARFGPFGGRYVPETVIGGPRTSWEAAYLAHREDVAFRAEARRAAGAVRRGRPTPLDPAAGLERAYGVARLWTSSARTLCHTRAHKIRQRAGAGAGWPRRWASGASSPETGAGQHGVATATAAALLGLETAASLHGARGHGPPAA